VLPEGGDLHRAGATDEGEGEIAAGGHDLGGGAAAQVGAILAKGQAAQPVTALDAPVAAYEREQAVRIGVAGGEAGDEIDRFRRRFLGGADRTDEAGDLGDARERKIRAQVAIEARARGERAGVSATTAALNRLSRVHGGAGVGEIGRQFGAQTGLVVLDRAQIGGAVVENALRQSGLGVQGVGGDDPPAQGKMGEEFLGYGDFIGLVADTHLHECFLGRVRGDGEQLRGRLRRRAGAAHDFAIKREGFTIAQRTRLLHPTRQRPLDMRHRQARQETPIERPRRRQMAPRPAHTGQDAALIARPASHRLQRVAIAQQRGHHTDQEEGQIVPLPPAFARVRDRRESRLQRAQARIGEQMGAFRRAQGGKEGRDGRILHRGWSPRDGVVGSTPLPYHQATIPPLHRLFTDPGLVLVTFGASITT